MAENNIKGANTRVSELTLTRYTDMKNGLLVCDDVVDRQGAIVAACTFYPGGSFFGGNSIKNPTVAALTSSGRYTLYRALPTVRAEIDRKLNAFVSASPGN